jgi:hypothetical protein
MTPILQPGPPSADLALRLQPDGKRLLHCLGSNADDTQGKPTSALATGRPIAQPMRHDGPVRHAAFARTAVG